MHNPPNIVNLCLELDLPEYESYETLRHQVLTAITAGSEYFGFA
jgi:E3 ubiquitin-protein ligase HUWE1